jgi:L-rhamnose isomerase
VANHQLCTAALKAEGVDRCAVLGWSMGVQVALELVRGNFLRRTHVGLDYFDASINRVAAWAVGTRNMLKALLKALLEPFPRLRELELAADYTSRLALCEEQKTLPFGAVWDYYCLKAGAPVGAAWLAEAKRYECEVLSKRS